MGIRGSLPLESKSSPVIGHSCFAPDDLGPSILTMGEQLAAVKTSAAQARLKWSVPFAKDWSLSAVTRDFSPAEPLSGSYRYGYIGSNTWRTRISGGIQPQTLASGMASGRLVDTEAGSSFSCSPFFRCQSLVKPSLETGSHYVHRKSHSPGKVVKGEQTSNGGSPCVESWKKDLSVSLNPEGLQVLLETDLGGAQSNVGVAMCGTPAEVCVSIASHPGDKEFRPGQQLSVKSVQVNNSHVKRSKESEEVCHSLSEVCHPRSPAARRTAAVGSSQANPLGTPVEEGFHEHSDVDCMSMSREGRRNKCSYQSSQWNLEADGNLEQSEECSVERNAKEPWCCEEGNQTQKTVPREISENSFWSLKVNEQSFWHLCDKQILTRCFQAWRRYILWKRAATQLYRHQLLQKGFGALQQIVHQRRTQLEVAQQRHASTLLAASFQRWKEAMAKQSKKEALQPDPYSYSQSSSAGTFGIGRLATMTTSAQHQLTTEYSKEVERAHRMEGELWTQQRRDEFCWRVEAIRDMRRLAAFRLWRLQKELLSKEEARLLEARALLEKKKLRNIFRMWHSQSLEMKEILTLTTQFQRNLVSRCFSTWKETVEQKALARCHLAHLRAVSLRKHFQQWVEMLQVREGDKQAVVKLFLLRWRRHCGAVVSSVADETGTKRHEGQMSSWTGERQFLEKTVCSFDDLCQKLKLQRVYLLWKTRLCEHHKANSFSQTLEQCKLRKTLKLWHQKYLMLKTIEQSSKHLHRAVYEEPLAMLFSEDLSTSSGFDSSAPATLTSQSSLEKECSLSDSSQHDVSSLLTAEDVTHMSCHSSFLQLHQCTELPAELGGELCLQTSSPGSERNCFVGNQFQSSVLQSPDNNSQPLTSYSAWEEGCSSDEEMKSCWQQAEKYCLQRCFIVWSARTQHHVKAQQHCRRTRLSRAFLSWHHWVMQNKNQKAAAAALKHGVPCVQMAFSLWKRRLAQKVEVDRRFRCHVHQMTADALRRWHSCWQRKHALEELQQQWAWHSCQEKKRLVLQTWYYQTRKQKYAVLFWERCLLHRFRLRGHKDLQRKKQLKTWCLVTWAQVTACKLRQHEALSYFKRVREHRLLVVSFTKWRDKLWRAEQVPEGRNHKWQEPSPGKACHRWRVAARGQQALRLGSVATVKQACNYWTRAAAFSQCLRQRSTLIGVRKSRKMSLSWPTKSRRGREEDSAPTGLFPSAIQRWLVIYRSQSRAERLLQRPDVVGPSRARARIQENAAEVDLEERAKKWLGLFASFACRRKYLKRWHHTVVLRRCQHDRKLLCLARGWHQWREASRVLVLARVLDQQRLIEKAWRVWRQRYLQSCVVQNLLEEEAKSLLSQVVKGSVCESWPYLDIDNMVVHS
ncbi:uncharacterized protein C1orf167 homolog isoform X2 [Motacilla alba alba]|uniref:uncharacterized protein C1orf167 homolog isoform X2 n=1 Tax=Motacilla alba alba TaxID=1094192 RepID=UPI0018D56A2B|nr:uncharacterized protein C1orf167 homolog isoform X2 [Motacilla alba alba]